MPKHGIPDTPSQSDFKARNGLRIARVDAGPNRRSLCLVALFRAASLLFGCVVASTGAAYAAPGEQDVLVFIPDDDLRWEVTQRCRCGHDSPITSADMRRLVELDIGPEVVDLSGLEFASNLRYLYINASRVSDLGPLRGMKNLARLDLGPTAVSDFSPLSDLTALSSLNWRDEYLSDLGPVANLRDLRRLVVRDSRVSDLGPLRNLTGLQSLSLTGSQVSDVEPLRNLTGLQSLFLTGSQVADLEPLSGLTKLTSLELSDTPVSDLEPLAGLVSLGRLVLDNAQVSSLTPLADLRDLRSLSAKNASNAHPPWDRGVECEQRPWPPVPTRFSNTVSDLAPLARLTSLSSLNLENNRVSTLTPLAGLKSLGWLWLSGNEITDLTGLEGLSELGVLDLTDNAVSSLEPLSGLVSLHRLYLNRNNISDLAPLTGLTRLQDLSLNDNKVSGLEPLVQLRLWELDLGNNNISNLDGLARLPRRDLFLEGNGITDLSPLLPLLDGSGRYGRRIDVRGNPLDQRSLEIASQRSFIFSEDDHGDVPQNATVVSVGTTTEGRIDPEHDVDYLELHVTETTGVDISTSRTSGAPRTMLHDESGVPLALGPLISESFEPGTHYLSVASYCVELPVDFDIYELERFRADYTLRITPAANVDIPDPNLRSKLRDAIESRLGQTADRVTTGGMLSLRSFRAADSDIADLRGLDRATEVSGIYLPGNVVSDLSPLSGLPQLEVLDLAGNAVLDLSPLAGLTRLRRLDISGNELSDLSALAGLKRLSVLDLSRNVVSDLSPLAGHTHLWRLILAGNAISDVEPLLEVAWPPDSWINLRNNPLSQTAISLHIPMLEDMGVMVQTQKDDHGDDWDEATWLQPGVPALGTSSQPYDWDRDYFRFEVTEPTVIHLSVAGRRVWDLRDSSGTTLFRSIWHGRNRANVRRKLEAGVYRILVWAGSESYTVQMNVVPAPTNMRVETDGSQAQVSWESSSPSSAEVANHAYIVVAVPVSGGPERSCWAPTNARGCVVSGLSEYDDYEFTVREVDPRGVDAGPVSAPVVVSIQSLRSFLRGWRLWLLLQPSRDRDASPEGSTSPERVGR